MRGYGLPAKYAKHGFKKGWKLYKAARKSTSTAGRKKTATKKSKKRVVLITNISGGARGENVMLGKRRRRKTRRTYGAVMGKRGRRKGRKVQLLGGGLAGKLMDAGLMAAGVIAGTAAIANVPWIKDQKPMMKGLIAVAAGIVAMQFIRQPIAKKAAAGIVASGALALVSPALINITPGESIPSLTTSGRRFSRDELAALQSMGRPYPIPLGKPAIPAGFSGSPASSYRSRLSTR